ncbi:hypothetical protein IWX49DRAFT_236870 [Phyllosticta citricarpa]
MWQAVQRMSALHACLLACLPRHSSTPPPRLSKRVLQDTDGAAVRPQCPLSSLVSSPPARSLAANFRRPRIDILSVRVAGPGKPRESFQNN